MKTKHLQQQLNNAIQAKEQSLVQKEAVLETETAAFFSMLNPVNIVKGTLHDLTTQDSKETLKKSVSAMSGGMVLNLVTNLLFKNNRLLPRLLGVFMPDMLGKTAKIIKSKFGLTKKSDSDSDLKS